MFNRASFVCVLLLGIGASAEDFNCPTAPIRMSAGKTGSLPAGATSMVKVPAKTFCQYQFEVPAGFALRVESSAVYEASPGDYVMFDDFFVGSPVDKRVEYAVRSIPYIVNSETGNLTFFATYSYIDVSGYKQKIFPTGSFFNIETEPNTYYTFKASQPTENVTFKLGGTHTDFYDWTSDLFVFDGDDIINSDYWGRLSDFRRKFAIQSSTDTVTFLNLYRDPSSFYVFGNDFHKIPNDRFYHAYPLNPTGETSGEMYTDEADDAYYTFYCDGCTHFYIDGITFNTRISNDTSGYMEVQPMSPTQGLAPILHYPFSPSTNSSLPQLIPTGMATFHIHKCSIKYVFRVDGALKAYHPKSLK